MAVNKVVYGTTVLVDLTTDTVTADTLKEGVTAHNSAGELITGTMPTTEQATPSISVNSSGLITASSTQSEGYVEAGTKSATKQLVVQATKTITPSTSSQTAVASGVYTTGVVTVAPIPEDYVKPTAIKGATTYTPTISGQIIESGTYLSGPQIIKGDINLVADNIKSGVSIFGVNGTYEGSGGGAETCTVTAGEYLYANIYYVDPVTGALVQSEPFYNPSDGYETYTILKNSIICMYTSDFILEWIVDNGEILTDFSDNKNLIVYVTGDCVISVG